MALFFIGFKIGFAWKKMVKMTLSLEKWL